MTLFCRQQVEYSDDDEPKPSVHLSQAQKLRKVIVELVDTERSYVKVNTNHIFQFLIHQLSFRLNVSVELIFSLDEGEKRFPVLRNCSRILDLMHYTVVTFAAKTVQFNTVQCKMKFLGYFACVSLVYNRKHT